MDRVWAIAAITFKEGIRNRALQGILCIAVLLCLGYLAVIPMFAFETGKVMVDLGAASVSVAGLVIVVFLAISMITRDIHQRSVCLILSRPVSRASYILVKFAGLATMVFIAVLSIACVALLSSVIGLQYVMEMQTLRNFSLGQLTVAVLFNYLALIILLSVAFLFTVATSSEYLSMLLTMMVYLIGHSLETIIKVASAGGDLKLSATYLNALKVFAWIFPNLSAFDLKVYVAYGLQLSSVQLAWTAAYGLCYTTLMVLATIAIFNRREIK